MVRMKNGGDILEKDNVRPMESDILKSASEEEQQITQLSSGVILVQVGQRVAGETAEI